MRALTSSCGGMQRTYRPLARKGCTGDLPGDCKLIPGDAQACEMGARLSGVYACRLGCTPFAAPSAADDMVAPSPAFQLAFLATWTKNSSLDLLVPGT